MIAPVTMRRASWWGMGSSIEVESSSPRRAGGYRSRRLVHLERAWSRFLPDSDISRALDSPTCLAVEVDASTVILSSSTSSGWPGATDGRFDPTLLPLLVDLGYRASLDDPDRVTSLAPRPVRCRRSACG